MYYVYRTICRLCANMPTKFKCLREELWFDEHVESQVIIGVYYIDTTIGSYNEAFWEFFVYLSIVTIYFRNKEMHGIRLQIVYYSIWKPALDQWKCRFLSEWAQFTVQ